MADVFLSYASRDLDLARALAATLQANGLAVWWDRNLLAGEAFQQTIRTELESAAAVVVLWTRQSAESEWVYSEARRAHRRGALVQVRTADVGIDDLPAPFDALHCPLVDDTGALLRAVAALTGAPAPTAAAPPPAAEPEQAHQERKVVTALAVELDPGAEVDPEDYDGFVARFGALVQDSVERFGGRLEPGGDTALTALFGVPKAHEDDPARAVGAAMALLDAAATIGGRCSRVGVATGQVLVNGPSVSGPVVPAARRLRGRAAPGAIVVDAETRSAAAAVAEFDATDDGWVVLGARAGEGSGALVDDRPMVGRETELLALQRSFTRSARESSVQLVTVVAEPGLGKSRLLRAFSDRLGTHEEPVTWLLGSCPPYGASMAQAALAEIVRTRTGVVETDSNDAALGKLEACVTGLVAGTFLADQASWLVSRLSPLLGLPATEAPAEELHQAWARFFELVTVSAPLVLVVEDLHWADQTTLDFLGGLPDWLVDAPVLLVVTARPELYERVPSWGAGWRNATTLNLAGLTEDETTRLVEQLLGSESLPEQVRETVLSRSGGNPLYAREYVAMVHDSPDADLAVAPGSLQSLVAARLDTLERGSRRTLQAGAVLGHTFWTGAVRDLTAAGDQVVEERLRDLSRREFVRRSRASGIAGESEYAISHALVAEVAYSELARADRARLHEAAGRWLAAPVDGASRAGDPALVAHHFSEALRWLPAGTDEPAALRVTALAAEWHTRAAQAASSLDATLAFQHADAAVALTAVDDPERPRRLMVKGTSAGLLGRADLAVDCLTEAHDVAERDGQVVLAGLAQARASAELRSLFRLDEAIEGAEGAVRVLESQPPGPELVEAYIVLSRHQVADGLRREAGRSTDRALELISVLPEVPVELKVRALYQKGQEASWTGDPRTAREHLLAALHLAEELQLTQTMSNLEDEIATLEYLSGSVQASVDHSEAAVGIAARGRIWSAYLRTVANHAEGLAMAGRVSEARELCEEASTRLPEVGFDEWIAQLQLCWSWLRRLCGDDEGARALSAAVYDRARSGATLEVLASLALFTAECHPPGTSRHRELLEELVAVAGVPEAVEHLAQYLARVARAVALGGDPDHLAVVEQFASATPPEVRFYANNITSARAELAEARGDLATAVRLHAEAAEAWAEQECPLEEAYARLGEARCLAGLGEDHAGAATGARDLFRDMGATGLVPSAERLLG